MTGEGLDTGDGIYSASNAFAVGLHRPDITLKYTFAPHDAVTQIAVTNFDSRMLLALATETLSARYQE